MLEGMPYTYKDLSQGNSINIVALCEGNVFGSITAVYEQPSQTQEHALYLSGIDIPGEGDKSFLKKELMEELLHVGHLRGVEKVYTTYHGDNRDMFIRIPPVRKHCKNTCSTRTLPTHCLNRSKRS
jgi:hypothetical protein